MKDASDDRALVLFEQVLDVPDIERAAFLDAACDPDLRARVEALLRADAEAHPLFGAGPADLAAVLPDEPLPSFEGRAIGPYRIVRLLGRGGMGAVYLAERADVGKRVALKLVAGGMASPDRIDRFLVERRVLARLEHPGIAGLLDAGVADDGTPWFAMEVVEGDSLDAYGDAHRLLVSERLALFEQVCEAVAYAHHNLVVHRDLKPSNVLVTEEGADGHPSIKLLDFGIARLLEEEADGLTRTGVAPMTPDFAAPEQVLGRPITAATDVYQLGVVLYELLSGHRPYRLGGCSLGEIERRIVRETPTRPSTAAGRAEEVAHPDGSVETVAPEAVAERRGTGPERLRRRLSGELDAIVMKALAKEPARRYASAEGLLDDLRRYRKGHPVAARPDSRGYRARKFVGRHPVGVGITLALLALTLGFGTFHTARVSAERDRAQLEAEKAERVSTFLTDLFAAGDPFGGGGLTTPVGDLLERGVEEVSTLEGQPEVQAEMLTALGRVFAQLGEPDRAQPMLERALALRREHLGADHPEVANSLNDLASLLVMRGRSDSVRVLARQALDVQETRLPTLDLDRARTLTLLGTSHVMDARYEDGEAYYRDALAVYRRLLPAAHALIGQTQLKLGRALVSQSRYDEALAAYEQAVETFEALPGQQEANLGLLYNNIAGVYMEQQRFAEAAPYYRQSLDVKRASLPAGHPSIGVGLINLGTALKDLGEIDESEALHREALEIERAAYGPHHPYVVIALNGIAFAAEGRGDYAAAEAQFAEALGVARATYPPGHPQVAAALANLGWVQTKAGRAARAEPLLREALTVLEEAFGEEHGQVAETQQNLGDALVQLGRYAEAEALLLRSLATLDAECSYDDCTEPTLQSLVALYEAWGRPEQAAPYRSRLPSAANADA